MGKILLIDDKGYIRKITSRILENRGHEVITTDQGSEGAKIAQYFKPDLILMDIRMPDTDGIETSRIIRYNQDTASIPIVILSAFAYQDVMVKLAEIGIEHVISKPYEVDDLINQVESYLKAEAVSN